jgi:uncharacterized protein
MTNHENDVPGDDSCQRFYLKNADATIGFIEYYPFGRVVIVTHTEVSPELEGKGHGSELARQAVNYFQSDGKQIVPICGFFAQFLRKHAEYKDVVTPESRRIFNI